MLWMNNWQVQVFTPLILSDPPSKLWGWCCRKHSFLSNYWFTIFVNKTIRSTLTLYIGISVIIGVAQQWKLKVFAFCEKFSQNFATRCQRFLSRFLMNTIICSILTLFSSCQCRHRSNFRTTVNLIFSKRMWPPVAALMKHDSQSSAWFHAWLIINCKR